MTNLSTSPTYRKFIEERNRALERILLNHQGRLSAIVDELEGFVLSIIPKHNSKHFDIRHIDGILTPVFNRSANQSIANLKRLRRLSYTLSYMGEAEAVARTTGKQTKYHLTNTDLSDVANAPSKFGAEIDTETHFYFDRLRRRVLDAIQMAFIRGEDTKASLVRVKAAFPRTVQITKQRRSLTSQTKLHEANELSEYPLVDDSSLATGFVDDESWQELVDEYLSGLTPRAGELKTRGRFASAKRTTKRDWEVEQFETDIFVQAVRDGQIDVAKENGYTDFVWIAVVDNKTDECCLWRDGLLVSEIEKELEGAHKDDPCETKVPPAHPNCRCDIAPVTDAILNFKPPPKLGDFETWLTAS